ncbi:MAG: ACT domain-containing protein [Planctomycetes bacterium]|nr:ACT domain-containing protein [Planctomycetota bacterium]
MASTLEFEVRPESLAIARLPPDAPQPPWARGAFVTVSRTPAELSVICDQRHVPPEVTCERERVALGIVGVVPMTTVGLLASLCGALAAAQVPVFVVSTYDTDWLLVQRAHLAATRTALEALGHRVRDCAPL